MAYQLAQAYVQIVPSMSGVGRAIQDAFGSAGDKGGAQAGKNFTSGFSAKIGAVAGVTTSVFNKVAGVVASSLNSAIGRADQMNNFPKVMKNLGYSSEDAAASIKKISAALDGLPTTSSAMTGMVQQLAPLTSNLDEATDIALAFNNAMLAGGASTIEQENALTQYTQMLSAGKVDMQAWRSIQAAMPGQLNQVAEAMMGAGHNANDLYEAMKDGTYSFDDFNKTVMRLNKQGFAQYASFAQQARDATQGIGTAFENVRNRVAKAVQKVIEAIGVENIAGAINDFSSQFGKIGDAAANMVTGVKNWLGQAAQAAKPLVSIWQGDFAKLGLYLTGLGANVAAFGKSLLDVITNGGGMQSFLVGLNNVISALVNWWIALTRNVSIFIGTLADTGGVQAFLAALGELWQGLTQLFQGLQDAATGLLEIGENGGAAAAAGKLVGDAFKVATPIVKALAGTLQSVGEWASEHGDIVRAAIIGIGTAFAAVKGYQALNSGLQALTGTMNTVTTAAKGISNGIMLMTDLGGPVAMLKQMAGGLSLVKTAQTAWSTATKMATAVQGAFNAVIAANPIGAIVVAVAAVVAALVWFFTQTETGRKAWAAFTSFLSSAWQKAVDFITNLGQNIANFFTQTLPNAFQSVIEWFQQLPERIGSALSNLLTAVGEWATCLAQSALQAGSRFVQNVADFIMHLPETIAYWLSYSITFVVAWVALMGQKAIDAGTQFVQNAGTFISQLPGNIWNWLVATVTNTANWVAQMAGKASEAGSQFLNNTATFISQLPGRIWAFLVNVLTGAANWAGQMASNAAQAGSSFIRNAIQFMSQLPGRIAAYLRGVISNVGNFAGQMGQGALNAGRQFLSNIVNTLASIPGRVVSIGHNIVKGIVSGIMGSIGRIGNAILGGVNDAIANVKRMLGIHSPSRLFRDQIGMMMGLGLANGIDASARYVNASMGSMIGGLMPDINDLLPANRTYDAATMNRRIVYTPSTDAMQPQAGAANVNITNYYPQADPWPLATNDSLDKLTVGI